jgi:hypothetical protein
MADEQHVVDTDSVNEERSDSEGVYSDIGWEERIHPEEREKLWTDEQLRSVVEDVLEIAQRGGKSKEHVALQSKVNEASGSQAMNTQTVSKPLNELSNQELEAWKAKLIERQNIERSEKLREVDSVEKETVPLAQEHSPRARDREDGVTRYRSTDDTRLQERLGVYMRNSKNTGRGTKSTRKRERSPSRELQESNRADMNTSIRPANLWYRDLSHMYGKTANHKLRAHVLRTGVLMVKQLTIDG